MQPETPDINIPTIGNKVMYTMMPVNDLMKLRTFIDALIKWKVQGNPVHIMSFPVYITETKEQCR